MAHLTKDHSSQARWITIYPAYLNSRRTQEEGRKIAKSKAVDNPKINEMRDVLQYHEFNMIVEENKQYPRDSFKDAFCKGRVRIQLKDADGAPVNTNYPTRKSIMIMLGEMIPKLKGRQSKVASSESSNTTQNIPTTKKKNKKKNK